MACDTQQPAQGLALFLSLARGLHHPLFEAGHGGGRRRGFDAFGIVQELAGEALDFGRHGCGEEQGLAREGQRLADALDVGDEAHVEHAVGFVDHQDLDAGEQQFAALEMIEQPARRCDHHIGAAIDLGCLFVERNAADQAGRR